MRAPRNRATSSLNLRAAANMTLSTVPSMSRYRVCANCWARTRPIHAISRRYGGWVMCLSLTAASTADAPDSPIPAGAHRAGDHDRADCQPGRVGNAVQLLLADAARATGGSPLHYPVAHHPRGP